MSRCGRPRCSGWDRPSTRVHLPRRRIAAIAVALMALSLLTPFGAAAAGAQATFGTRPLLSGSTTLSHGHFAYALTAGSSIHDGLVVENFSDHPLQVDVYGADILQAQGGGLAPTQEGQPQHGVGAWLRVSQLKLTVPPRRSVTDSFTLSLPAGVTPGNYLGAMVAAAKVGSDHGITIQGRVALLVEVTVPGTATPAATLGPLSDHAAAGSRTFSYTVALTNTGNVLLSVRGTVDMTDSSGRLHSLPLVPQDAYAIPTGTLELHTAAWTFGTGSFTVQAHVTTYIDGKPVHQYASNQLHYTFLDWILVGLVAAAGVLLLLYGTYRLRRRRRRRRRREQEQQDMARRLRSLARAGFNR